jgi:hypothetical protein
MFTHFLQSCSLHQTLQPFQNLGAAVSLREECCFGQGRKLNAVTCCVLSFRVSVTFCKIDQHPLWKPNVRVIVFEIASDRHKVASG